jgi:amidase
MGGHVWLSASEQQRGMAEGRLTSHGLALEYISRISQLDAGGPRLRSVLEVNPEALSVAEALDRERGEVGPRGPLHGVCVLLKDNIDTADTMHTTAGSFALVDSVPVGDAHIVSRLRDAGAVILGKANLSEWANFRGHSSSGWSGRGGQALNPHVLTMTPSGSSSGSGISVAAALCALAVGSETDGRYPAF